MIDAPSSERAASAACIDRPSQAASPRSSLSPLAAELNSCLPVLPVMALQLRNTVREVEDAVVGVCGSFQEIARRAREVVSSGVLCCAASGPGQGGTGVERLIEDTRQTMGRLLQRIEQSSQVSAATVSRLQEIEKRMQGVHETLAEIDRISAQARLLAFNGQLEAARAGEYGAAFGIVATETAKMAQHTVDASKSIRAMIDTLSTNITSGAAELRHRVELDQQEVAGSRSEVTQSLDALAGLHTKFCRAVEETKTNSVQIGEDISQAVVAMQFQDAMSQRMEHVAHTLEEIHGCLLARLTQVDRQDPAADAPAPHDWSERMRDRYTMANEHRTLAAHLGGPGSRDEAVGDNVQLF